MIQDQIIKRGINQVELIRAFYAVDRAWFVNKGMGKGVYGDHPLPIGHKQTMSQPYIVAYMLNQLDLKKTDKVLEIGMGSGYQTALLAELVAQVYTVEVIEALFKQTKDRLMNLNFNNIHYYLGDGYLGLKTKSPFQKIVVSCYSEDIPVNLYEQLDEGGKMILPIGNHFAQRLYLTFKEMSIPNNIYYE